MKGSTVRESLAFLQSANARSFLQGIMQRISPAGTMIQDSLRELIHSTSRPDVPQSATPLPEYTYINQPVEIVKSQLEAANVSVQVHPYDPALALHNVATYLGGLGRLVPGGQVTLFTEGETVKSVAIQPPAIIEQREAATPAESAVTQDSSVMRSEIASLREELNRMQQASEAAEKALQDRDARINELFDSLASIRVQIDKPSGSARKSRSTQGIRDKKT